MVAAALGARAVTWGAVGELLPGCAGRENTGTTGKVAPLWLAGQKRLSTQGLCPLGLLRLHTGTCSSRRLCFTVPRWGPSAPREVLVLVSGPLPPQGHPWVLTEALLGSADPSLEAFPSCSAPAGARLAP